VLALPEDMLTDEVEVADAGPYKIARGAPSSADMATLRGMLAEARQPMVIVGGGGWSREACADMTAFAVANGLPVTTAFRNQDLIDNRHPNFVGDLGIGVNPPLGKRLKDSDLILAVGPRLGEATTGGYTLFDLPVPAQPLVHVHASAEELGRVYQTVLPINSGMANFAAAARAMKPVDGSRWKANLEGARADYLKNIEPNEQPGAVNVTEIVAWLNKRLPDDAILTNGAGNYAAFLHRFFQYRGFKSQLAPTSGAMGYGVPASVAAKIAAPDRMVVSFAGQRHVRHHPHASGARVPDARARHRAQEPRLRRLCARLRRPRRDGRQDGRLRRRFRARGGGGQARHHPSQDRSRGSHLAHHPEQAARAVAGAAEAQLMIC